MKNKDVKDRKLENVFLIKIQMSADAFVSLFLRHILINTENVLCFFSFHGIPMLK